jgi:hypothetical protein
MSSSISSKAHVCREGGYHFKALSACDEWGNTLMFCFATVFGNGCETVRYEIFRKKPGIPDLSYAISSC